MKALWDSWSDDACWMTAPAANTAAPAASAPSTCRCKLSGVAAVTLIQAHAQANVEDVVQYVVVCQRGRLR